MEHKYGVEVDHRHSNGIDVFMYYLEAEFAKVITIHTVSEIPEYNVTYQVPPEKALQAFNHPFAEAPDERAA